MTRLMRAATGIALTLMLAGTVGACDSFLDVNTNPNEATDVRMELTLPGMLMAFTQNILGFPTERYGSTKGFASWGTEWTQQWSYNVDERPYSQFQHYEMSSGDADEPWGDAYADVMQECVLIMAETSQTEDWAYHGIAKFIFAWTASIVSDAWGPVPLTEAFDPQERDPVYDSQQAVYEEVHRMIEEAIDEMQRPSPRSPAANDLLYDGDMNAWVKLARTVQARLHLRLAYAPGESAEQRAQRALDALAAGFTSNADDADFEFTGGSGARSSRYEFENDGDEEPNVASVYYIDLLQGLGDPRLPITVEPALIDGVYRGHLNGALSAPDSSISKIGDYFTADSTDLNWISHAEARFIEAEAQLILNGAGAADGPYREGIRANMEKMGVAPADIDAYLTARPSLASAANPLEAIITQKYIANFLNHEVWNDWRRTGYPVLTPVADRVIDAIPRRLRTPADEISYNAESVAATGISPALDGMLVEVWWASGSRPQ